MPYYNLSEMSQSLEHLIGFEKDRIVVTDPGAFREDAIDRLVRSAIFGSRDVKEAAIWVIWAGSQALGCGAASIAGLAHAIERGELGSFSVPVMNIRGLNYTIARTMLKAAMAAECGAVLFELSLREIGSQNQRPAEFAAILLAAAIKERWNLPIMIQGGYFQLDPSISFETPDSEISLVGDITKEAIEAGMYNINTDAPLANGFQQAPDQKLKYACSEKITSTIEAVKPNGVDVFKYETDEKIVDENGSPGSGIFKRESWDFHEDIQDDEAADLLYEFNTIFNKVAAQRTNDIVRRHVIPVPVNHPRTWFF
ncbi:MAG: hypothetical protein GY762_12790 [Proteobacteria bacterium]|nr:hypothetical protein [Pseudomonadota bacterium]